MSQSVWPIGGWEGESEGGESEGERDRGEREREREGERESILYDLLLAECESVSLV